MVQRAFRAPPGLWGEGTAAPAAGSTASSSSWRPPRACRRPRAARTSPTAPARSTSSSLAVPPRARRPATRHTRGASTATTSNPSAWPAMSSSSTRRRTAASRRLRGAIRGSALCGSEGRYRRIERACKLRRGGVSREVVATSAIKGQQSLVERMPAIGVSQLVLLQSGPTLGGAHPGPCTPGGPSGPTERPRPSGAVHAPKETSRTLRGQRQSTVQPTRHRARELAPTSGAASPVAAQGGRSRARGRLRSQAQRAQRDRPRTSEGERRLAATPGGRSRPPDYMGPGRPTLAKASEGGPRPATALGPPRAAFWPHRGSGT